MVFDTTTIPPETASELVRRIVGRPLAVTGMRRLEGGMVNSVLELTTDGEPRQIVAKLNAEVGRTSFERERDILLWHREHSPLPVPMPYGCDTSGEVFGGSCLLLERLPGVNLAQARLSGAETVRVECEMARILAEMHGLTRETYGFALRPAGEGRPRWLGIFRERITSEYEDASPRLSARARRNVEAVLDELDAWLPEAGRPTLVHGDLWATNILVGRNGAGEPFVSGFVDGSADFADVEYELAYLLVFNTVGSPFFQEYARHHPIREGFELRCRVYWLHTMLLHVRAFGDAHYVRNSEALAEFLVEKRAERGIS